MTSDTSIVKYGSDVGLVVVDVQNDFADRSGSLPVPGALRVLPVINREIAAARAAGSKVCYSADWHPPETPHFVDQGGPWPPHCVRNTWGAAFHPDLVVAGEVVRKATGPEDGYSAFTVGDVKGATKPTRLGPVLKAAGIRKIVIVGLATDYCVLASALDAVDLGLETVVLRDGVGAVDVHSGDGDRALERMVAAGVDVV